MNKSFVTKYFGLFLQVTQGTPELKLLGSVFGTKPKEPGSTRTRYFLQWFKKRPGVVCEICGESHWSCLQFHHRNPEKKLDSITYLAQASHIKVLIAEMAKCNILCANCHFKLHHS